MYKEANIIKSLLILILTIYTISIMAQTDTVYVIKNGQIIAKYNTKTDLDSIVFYNPINGFLNTKLSLVDIPAGMFIMGSPTNEVDRNPNETQFPVSISSFRMSKYEITNSQFADFLNAKLVGSNGIDTKGNYPTEPLIYSYTAWGLVFSNSKWKPVTGYENAPAVHMTWYGADEFARYVGGNLPTEAQWEYACRAGATTTFNTGSCLTYLQANYNWTLPYNSCINSNTNYPVHPINVGTYAPNAFGLFDMHGNAWEWCADWQADYPTTLQTDPKGPNTGTGKVVRGGSWYHAAKYARAANRNGVASPTGYAPSYHDGAIGFRVVFIK